MDKRTFRYLRGRFGDYYRRTTLRLPPDADRREWGFVPWSEGPGTTMSRHHALYGMESIQEFLSRKKPHHVYFSASLYEDPGAPTMDEKNWQASDLVFDLDADHLPAVDPESTSYRQMLTECKSHLKNLLSLLEEDLGFDDLTVVFSGGRGYHVHVRDEKAKSLTSGARQEIVNYVVGDKITFEELTREKKKNVYNLKNFDYRTFNLGGWGERAQKYSMSWASEYLIGEENEAAIEEACNSLGLSEETATTSINRLSEVPYAFHFGAIPEESRPLAERLLERTVAEQHAAVDQPVTTDINRLIRFPQSLHGGHALKVTQIDPEDVNEFSPLSDAVPEFFAPIDIDVQLTESVDVELNGTQFSFEEGDEVSVPEYAGLFLMTHGQARKLEQ